MCPPPITPDEQDDIKLKGADSTIIGNVSDRLKVDAAFSTIPVTPVYPGGVPGIAHGQVTLSASGIGVVRKTAYTEQTSNAQRSIVSSSASDTSAGTGARTVKVTYYDVSGNGPFTETLTMNGTSAVNTVSTTICFVERIEVLSYGSFGANVGTISLKAATGGGGATVFSIAIGDNTTLQAHHYVATGKIGYIKSVTVSSSSGDSALFYLIFSNHATDFDSGRQDQFQCPVSGSFQRHYDVPLAVPSGFHFALVATADSAGTYYGTIDYFDV